MPLYDYECLTCRYGFEIRQNVSEVGNAECPKCSADSRRVFHSVPILFKGSGFYSTDHRKGEASQPADGGSDGGSDGNKDQPKSKTDSDTSTKSDGKSDVKAEKKVADKVAPKTDK